jgi:outer membrane protein assembly factor BamE (lipoprotein component of BamABCDE complex)
MVGKTGGVRMFVLVTLLSLALTACQAINRNHGYIPPEEDLAQLTVGLTTRDEALALLGRPTSAGLVDANGLYYVQSRFRHYGPLEPEEVDRQVLAVSFSESGTLTNVERFGLEDGQVVALSRRVTDTGVQGISFLRQLFGALGNFDAGSFIGAE